MLKLAWKNLLQNRMRAGVALGGIIFAVLLVTVEMGMLFGQMRNAALLIDSSRADIWVSVKNVKTFDFASPVPQRLKYLISTIKGVEKVEEFNVTFSVWKLPTGANVNCKVVGIEEKGELGPVLNFKEGGLERLHNQSNVMLDDADQAKLGFPSLGDYVEIARNRSRIAGFTRHMRSFGAAPYVFTSLKNSRRYGALRVVIGPRKHMTQTVYFLVKTTKGINRDAVCQAIESGVPGVGAATREAFSWRTRRYWIFETGLGIGFLVAALLGFFVGTVIVSQSLFALTHEKIMEFAVLRALGASMSELATIVLSQGGLLGALGLSMGLAISFLIRDLAINSGTTIVIQWGLIVAVIAMTALLSVSASLCAIIRLRRVEPASVFH